MIASYSPLQHGRSEGSGSLAETAKAPTFRPLLLKVPEACEVLGISRSQLYLQRREGRITFVTIGPRQVRVPYAECEAWVARKIAETDTQGSALTVGSNFPIG